MPFSADQILFFIILGGAFVLVQAAAFAAGFYKGRIQREDSQSKAKTGAPEKQLAIQDGFSDLLEIMKRQQESNDLSLRLDEKPGSETEEIARQYNHLMESLEQVISKARAIINSSKDGIFTCSMEDLKIASLNPGAESMYRTTFDKLIGRQLFSIFEFKNAEDLTYDQILNRLLSGRIRMARGKRPDGTTFPVELSLSRVNAGTGSFITLTIHDATEHEEFRRKTEERAKELEGTNQYLMNTKTAMINIMEELEEEKRKGQMILESAGEGIFGLDTAGRTTFINPIALKMLGYETEKEVTGKNQHDLIHYQKTDGSPFAKSECRISRSIREGIIEQSSDEVFMRKNGTPLQVQYICTPIIEDGSITGAVVTFNDITEQRKLEMQLAQSQKMEGVGRLAGGVAHDFNNLLTVMSGYCEILLGSSDEKDSRTELVKEIQAAVTRATSLTRQLLAFSRRQVMSSRAVNVNELVKNMESMLQRLILENIELTFEVRGEKNIVKIDPGQLEQVILNLVVNAVDAVDDRGAIRICVRDQVLAEETPTLLEMATGRSVIPAGHYVVISVSDNGAGIPDEIKGHIFEPFYTTKGQGKGTGLGLSTAYGVIKQCEGYFRLQSEMGSGSEFSIYLPVYREAAKPEAENINTSTSLPQGSETLLLVEDEPSLRKLISRSLEEQGYRVHEARNGMDAIRKVEDLNIEKIDLLLTDVVMPKMSGKELDAKLQAMRPGMKTIFMSGYTEDQNIDQRLLERGVYFLQKPFKPSDVLLKVRQALDGERPESEVKDAA